MLYTLYGVNIMQKKRLILSFFLLLTISFVTFGEKIENSKNLLTGKLPNGLTYYIYKNKKPENRAELNLIVKAGSLLEDEKEQGIAHFMEHMAFNGTKKYEKNEMIKYLESLGLSFGGDLNAYTSFDRTVYKLIVPTNNTSSFEKGVEVLREWATEATLESQQVESEKKVIIEEWRLRQGLAQRLGDIQKKAIFSGSRYFDRFPIGLPKTINEASSDIIRGYYEKWYTPKNMAVAVVGDIDTKKVEELIKKYFSFEEKTQFTQGKDFKLKDLKNSYVVFTDPEIRYSTLTITKFLDRKIIDSIESFQESIEYQLLFNILNSRIVNITKESSSPIIDGEVYSYSINKYTDIFSTAVALREDKLKEGITLINNILKSSATNGISKAELELEKKNMFNYYKSIVANKDSIRHNTYIDALVDHIVDGESFIDVEHEFEIFKRVLKNIDISQLNKKIKEIYNKEGVYFLSAPQKDKIISKEILKNIIEKDRKNFNNLLTFNNNIPTLPPLNLKEGSFKKFDKNSYLLSNGIKVSIKHSDFEKDRIYIKLFKKEGSSVNNYKEYLNSLLAPNLVANSGASILKPNEIESFMKGKNFNISSYINDYEQGFTIISDRENLVPALEYLNYSIREPKIDTEIFNTTILNVKENIKNRDNSPMSIYGDKITAIYSGNNERRKPFTLKDLEKINKDEALNIFKEKFDNFNGYELIIVGSFDEKEIPKILKKYFASLPTDKKIIVPKSLNLDIPKNIINEKIVKGIDKKATVTFIFPYNSIYGYNEKVLYSGFSKVLNIALIEDIREKIGGVYSIYSKTSLSPNNFGENLLTINFSCDTNRVDEISNAVLNSVKSLLENIDQKKINSVVKNYELSYDTELKENSFWVNYLYQKATVGKEYKIPTPKEYKEIMTKENLINYNKKAINLDNYINVTLIPEKESL